MGERHRQSVVKGILLDLLSINHPHDCLRRLSGVAMTYVVVTLSALSGDTYSPGHRHGYVADDVSLSPMFSLETSSWPYLGLCVIA